MKLFYKLFTLFVGFILLTSFKPTTLDNKGYHNYDVPLYELLPSKYSPDYITLKVKKSTYTVSFYYNGQLLKSYPCVFGKDPYNDKHKRGDYRTPEGDFKITELREHFIWGYFIGINYPNNESWERFESRKMQNIVSPTDEIGGDVGFHGVIDGLEFLIDERNNWTEGCISLKNMDINEIALYMQPGVNVRIDY